MRNRQRPITFKVLSVGVNGTNLRYPRKDASDIARAVSGAAGLVGPEDVTCLHEATIRELRAALLRLSIEQPTFLLFFFAGHGTPTGIMLADEEMSFRELAYWLRRINAKASLTILDSCHSGAFLAVGQTTVGALDVDALEILVRAVPGNRVICSVAADRLAGEGGDVPNGHLTAALLAAMTFATGDLAGRRGRMISDERIFNVARSIMRRRWRQTPVARGLRGDFPVVRAQDEVFGQVAITDAGLVDGIFCARFAFLGRRGLPTTIVVEARGAHDTTIVDYRNVVVATEDIDRASYSYPISSDLLLIDAMSVQAMARYGHAPVRWIVSVLDGRGRVLIAGHRDVLYADAFSSSPAIAADPWGRDLYL